MSRKTTTFSVVEFLIAAGLDDSYGVSDRECKDAKGRTISSVTFCKARILDGVVNIYSDTFIQVKWMTGIRTLSHQGSKVYRSFADFVAGMCEDFHLENPFDNEAVAKYDAIQHAMQLEDFATRDWK